MKKLLSFFFLLSLAYATQAQIQMNEVLYDPPDSTAGDANGDGVRDAMQDEFIEFVNAGQNPVDMSKYRIYDVVLATGLKTLRHTIPLGTVVTGGGAVVVFGGGTPTGTFGGAIVIADRGTQGLSLGNTGEAIVLTDSMGLRVDSMDTDALSNNPNESYTANPDFTRDYVQHHLAQAGVLFSPGLRVDGNPFEVTAVRGAKRGSVLAIAPNPGTGLFCLSEGETGIVEVTDATGRTVPVSVQGRKIDLQNQPNGLYIISVRRRSGRASARVQVSR